MSLHPMKAYVARVNTVAALNIFTLIIAPANISVVNHVIPCFIVPLIAVGRFFVHYPHVLDTPEPQRSERKQ
jgi:hypothetical protein